MSKIASPLVSIIITVYNADGYLRASVKSILSQTYTNLEILIINDGSTDGCMDSISDLNDPRIRIMIQANKGRPAALNRALGEITGEFYAIQDADDVSYPERIEHQLKCMLENPDTGAVFTGNDIIIEGQRLAPRFSAKNAETCRRDIERFRMPAHDPTGMYRVSTVKDIRYDSSLPFTHAVDYILHVGELNSMIVLGECLYSYRIHFKSLTRRDPARTRQDLVECLRHAHSRRGLTLPQHLIYDITKTGSCLHRGRQHGVITQFIESVLDLRRVGQRWNAFKTAMACLRLHPRDPYYYKPLIYFLAPFSFIKFYRSQKAKLLLF